jgi:hypothetical protein
MHHRAFTQNRCIKTESTSFSSINPKKISALKGGYSAGAPGANPPWFEIFFMFIILN